MATKMSVPVATVAHGLRICHESDSIWPSSGLPLTAVAEKSPVTTQYAPPM